MPSSAPEQTSRDSTEIAPLLAAAFKPVELAQRWRTDRDTIYALIRSRKLAAFDVSAPGSKRPSYRISAGEVDLSVFNAARITKLYGTMVRKGQSTIEQPHRRSELIYVPDYLDLRKEALV